MAFEDQYGATLTLHNGPVCVPQKSNTGRILLKSLVFVVTHIMTAESEFLLSVQKQISSWVSFFIYSLFLFLQSVLFILLFIAMRQASRKDNHGGVCWSRWGDTFWRDRLASEWCYNSPKVQVREMEWIHHRLSRSEQTSIYNIIGTLL